MNHKNKLIIFRLDEQRYALPLSAAECVIRVVEITPLPKAPEVVMGIINMRGNVIPVLNIRKRFRLSDRDLRLSDQFLMAHTSRRSLALWVDTVTDIIEPASQEMIDSGDILSHLDYVEGVVKLEDGLILIHNLDTFLSLEEETALEEAMLDA